MLVASLVWLGSAAAHPAVIFEMGGKFDRSFNQAAFDGAQAWAKEAGKPYLEFEITNAAQREFGARRFAERGANPNVGIGFSQASSIEKVAREFPRTQFAIVDAVVDLPNVQSLIYREHEVSFLVGVLAAMASKTGKVGIGVDCNQNHLPPGSVLTSMVKRLDRAVLSAFNGVKPGVTALGLQDGALDDAMDEHNANLATAAMRAAANAARADIIAGRLKVVDCAEKRACRWGRVRATWDECLPSLLAFKDPESAAEVCTAVIAVVRTAVAD